MSHDFKLALINMKWSQHIIWWKPKYKEFSLLKFFSLIYLDQILKNLVTTIEIWNCISWKTKMNTFF